MLHACVIFEMINISEFTTHTAECYNNLYVCASTLCDPMDHSPPGSSVHGIFPARNTGVGCHFLLQGIFPTQRWNSCLLHLPPYRRMLYR